MTAAVALVLAATASHANPPDDAAAPRDVANYTLSATLDAARHVVAGDGTLAWTNTSRVPVSDLWFHLYLNGFEGERTYFMRTTGGVHRGNERGRWGRIDLRALALDTGEDLLATATNDPAVPDDRSQLHVTLPRAVPPGATITVAMAFTSVLPEVFARTGFHERFHMVAQWFPKVAVLEEDGAWSHFPFHGNTEFYADFGRYDVTVTVPRGWTVGATGEPVDAVVRAPDGDRHRFRAWPVHDFAFTAWDGFRERRGASGDAAIRVLYPPGEERGAASVIECLERGMPAFQRRFGAYPYPGLTVVIPPRGAEGACGMEYPTLITTASVWAVPPSVRFVEYVTLHEFAHQYFYGMVASSEWASPFLDEGFTEYATALAFEDLYGPGAPLVDVAPLGFRFDAFAYEALASAQIRNPMAVARGASEFPTFASYASHVYPRTATILRTAERATGRERFRLAMRAYAERWRFRHPRPEDFFASMRDSLGPAVVDDLLRPALTEPLRLDYEVLSAESHREHGRYAGRVIVQRAGTLRLPVDVVFERADGTRTRTRWDGLAESAELPYSAPVALRAVRIDPQGDVPLDERRVNNALLASDAEAPSMLPGVARVAYWVGLVLQAVGP